MSPTIHRIFRCAALVALVALAVSSSARAQKSKAIRPLSAKVVAKIAADLAAADPATAIAAAKQLGKAAGATGLEALLDALSVGLHPKVAVAALDAVSEHSSPKAFEFAATYARHRNPNVRAAAVRALVAGGGPKMETAVLAALHDGNAGVRLAAADAVAAMKIRAGIEPLLALLARGDDAAVKALGRMADADLARRVAEAVGTAPDTAVARCLGTMLVRADFGPEEARVEVVRALGRVPGDESLEQLTNYVATIPEKPPRASRTEAEATIETRLGGS